MGGPGSGRRPAPTTLKLLHGARPSRINWDEPTASGTPQPLGELSAAAQTAWDKIVPPLVRLGVVGEVDGLACTELANAIADEARYRRLVEAAPLIKDKDGRVRRNPASFALSEASARVARWAVQLGCTPVARAALHVDHNAGPAIPGERLLS